VAITTLLRDALHSAIKCDSPVQANKAKPALPIINDQQVGFRCLYQYVRTGYLLVNSIHIYTESCCLP
jgi:hypothetical protein